MTKEPTRKEPGPRESAAKKSGISIVKIPPAGLARRIIAQTAAFLLTLIPAFITRYLMNEMIDKGREIPYHWLAIVIAVSFAIHIFLFYFSRYRSQVFCNELASDFGSRIGGKIASSSMPDYEAQSKSKILNIMQSDVSSIYTQYNYMSYVPVCILEMIVVLILIFQTYPLFGLLAVLLAPVYLLSSYTNKSRLEQLAGEERKAADEWVQDMEVMINGKVGIGLSRAFPYILGRFRKSQAAFYRARNRQHFYLLITKELPNLITTMAPILILVTGGNAVVKGRITIGALLFAMQVIDFIFSPLTTIAMLHAELMSQKPIFQRGKDFVALPDQPKELSGDPGTAICLKNAVLCRPDGTPLIDIEDFSVEGCGLALIKGGNGCGKSTLFNVLSGVFSESQLKTGNEGRISISSRYRNDMGYLYYPNFIFKGTVKENVLCGREISDADYKHVNNLLHLPPAEKEVQTKPENLSLGEKQKIYLARLLTGGHECLLLDEPGSNLDDRTEENLIREIETLKETPLILVISHNDRYDGIADWIYRIQDGKMTKERI